MHKSCVLVASQGLPYNTVWFEHLQENAWPQQVSPAEFNLIPELFVALQTMQYLSFFDFDF